MPKKAPNNYTDNLSEDETPKGAGDKKDRANRGDKETASGEVNVA